MPCAIPGTEDIKMSRTLSNRWMCSGAWLLREALTVESNEVMETEHKIMGPSDVKAESVNQFALKLVV